MSCYYVILYSVVPCLVVLSSDIEYVCVHVLLYVCMHVCMYVCMYVFMNVCMHADLSRI